VFIFWRSQREQQHQALDQLLSHPPKKDEGNNYNDTVLVVEHSHQSQQDTDKSSPVKVRVMKGFKDESLHKTIYTMQNVTRSSRKVVDPEMTRKEKLKLLKQENVCQSISGQKDGRND